MNKGIIFLQCTAAGPSLVLSSMSQVRPEDAQNSHWRELPSREQKSRTPQQEAVGHSTALDRFKAKSERN